jgi:fatty-acyl-CoA synthase
MVPSNQFSSFASILGNFSSLIHGATLTLPCEQFNPQEVLKFASQEQINVLFGETNEFKQLLNHPDLTKYDYSSLRSLVIGTFSYFLKNSKDSTASSDFINELKNKFKAEVYQIKGFNETCGLLQVNDTVVPNIEMKIVRPSDGKILESETNGWLKVKGFVFHFLLTHQVQL